MYILIIPAILAAGFAYLIYEIAFRKSNHRNKRASKPGVTKTARTASSLGVPRENYTNPPDESFIVYIDSLIKQVKAVEKENSDLKLQLPRIKKP